MPTVLELDESGVRFILCAEEQFGDLIAITDSTLGRTGLPTQPYALMTATCQSA